MELKFTHTSCVLWRKEIFRAGFYWNPKEQKKRHKTADAQEDVGNQTGGGNMGKAVQWVLSLGVGGAVRGDCRGLLKVREKDAGGIFC